MVQAILSEKLETTMHMPRPHRQWNPFGAASSYEVTITLLSVAISERKDFGQQDKKQKPKIKIGTHFNCFHHGMYSAAGCACLAFCGCPS
jgi:hypothetical protein